MPIEQEAKFAVQSVKELRGKLETLGSLHTQCRFERNLLFDTPAHDLKKRGELLRLRETDTVLLTWKRPAPHSGVAAGIKAMEEVETPVNDFEAMRRILRGLGFIEVLWYEKFREVWTLGDALVCLDILPFGEFVEIEGEPETIARAAVLLGLDMADAQALTYPAIVSNHGSKTGNLPVKAVFPERAMDRAATDAGTSPYVATATGTSGKSDRS